MGERPLKSAWRSASYLVLLVPCLWVLWAAWGEDRAGWRELRPGEATALMQAESWLQDGDFTFERLDFERHVVTRYGLPGDLALASGTGGRVLTYDASFVPALLNALGLSFFGEFGFAMVNALLMLAALAFVVASLRHELPRIVAPWLAVLVFASVGFAYIFQATPHALLFAATLAAAGCVLGGGQGSKTGVEGARPVRPRRWWLAGLLLSLALFTRWQHAFLLLPFLMAVPEGAAAPAKRMARLSLGIGVIMGLAVQALVLWSSGGGLGVADTVRFVFTPASGFPLIDLPTEGWERVVERVSALHFVGAPRFAWGLEPTLLAKNALYYLAGQNIGLVPYALAPLALLGLGAKRRMAAAWGLALGLTFIAALLLEPFNLAGGGAPGNPHLLPLLAATVLVWRPQSRSHEPFGLRSIVALGLVLLAAAPFLVSTWLGARLPPSQERELGLVPSHASDLSRALLPYELSQQTLPGSRAYDHAGLRVRLLSSSLAEKDLDVFTLQGSEAAHLWVASPTELRAIYLSFGEDAPATIELLGDGGTLLDRELRSDGGVSFRVISPAVRHVMWWSPRAQWVYRVDFRLPGAGEKRLEWSLTGEPVADGGIR